MNKRIGTGAHMRSHSLGCAVSSSRKQRRGSAFRTTLAIAQKSARKRELKEASRRIDTEVFAIEGVANFLHCSVQVVRNIPVNELPRADGPGRRLLFLRSDVIEYVRRHRTQGTVVDKNSCGSPSLIDSEADNVRGRS